MTSQSGGSVNGYPGVASDGASGLILTGGVSVNGGAPDTIPGDDTPYSAIGGQLALQDTAANVENGDPPLYVLQNATLTADPNTPVALLWRKSPLGGFDNTGPVVLIIDNTLATGPLLRCQTGAGNVFAVNKAGGVGQYGHTPPAAQPTPTIATSTITDAVAKAAIKALILIINNSGAALITET